jgi:RNA polymerase sigma factor (sigma-70 family)
VTDADDAAQASLVQLEPRLRRALVARYGVDIGCDAAAEAVVWALENPHSLTSMQNPAGYLFRVGQSAARRLGRLPRPERFPSEPVWEDAPALAGDVFEELARLKPPQRVAVLLIHGYGFTYRDVADLLDVSEAAVTNHVHRGMKKLRERLEGTR